MDEKNQNIVEFAKKKRHLALVEKLGKGSLTPREMKELQELENEEKGIKEIMPPGEVDLATISVYLDKSSRMIRRYIKRGMPVVWDETNEITNCRFKVADVFRWFYAGLDSGEDNRSHWDIEYKKNKAKLSEIELKEKERELIPHTEHVSILKNQIRGIKAGFLRLPKYIAPKLYQQEPKIICEMLDNELRYIIGQFAGSLYASKGK
jgi:hypothetical protein